MTIQKAIRSGKRFRRPGFVKGRWLHIENFGIRTSDSTWYYPCLEEITATDWELEEDKVTITLDQLKQAYYMGYLDNSWSAVWNRLKELTK